MERGKDGEGGETVAGVGRGGVREMPQIQSVGCEAMGTRGMGSLERFASTPYCRNALRPLR